MSDTPINQAQRMMDILREVDARFWPGVLAEVMAEVTTSPYFSAALWRDLREQTEDIVRRAEGEEDEA